MKKLIFWTTIPLLGAISITACGSGGNLSEAEKTAQVQTVVFAATQQGTVVAMQATADSAPIMATQLAQLQQENNRLGGTVEAVTTAGVPFLAEFTPTSRATTQVQALAAQYTDVLTTPTINEANGCATGKNGRFSEDVPIIYFATLAFDVPQGAAHRVEWYFEDSLRYSSDDWIADQNYDEICIYFWLEQAYTNFEDGFWSVQFFVDDDFIVDVPFEMCESGVIC